MQKRKCHITLFIAPEILNSKKNSETWHTETLGFYKPVAKRINSIGLMDKKLLLVKVGLDLVKI